MSGLAQKIKEWNAKRFGRAVFDGDVEGVKKMLNKGLRQAYFQQMQRADFGQGNEMIPAAILTDPYQILKVADLSNDKKAQIWSALAQAIPVAQTPTTPKA